jgi:hypothetical protein
MVRGMAQLRQMAAGFSLGVQKQLRSSRCRICGRQMALQHIFIQVFWFSLSVIIPSILHTHMNSCTYKISTQKHVCVCVCESVKARTHTHTHTCVHTHTHTHTFRVWYPWCASSPHYKRKCNPSMYNFTVASINCNCTFQLIK